MKKSLLSMKKSTANLPALADEEKSPDNLHEQMGEVESPWSTKGTGAQSILAKTSEEVADMLGSSTQNGLTNDQAKLRLQYDGPNKILSPNNTFLLRRFFWAFFGGFAPVIWASVFLSFTAHATMPFRYWRVYSLIVATVLIAIILLNGMIQFYQEVKSAHILRRAWHLVPRRNRVIRDGRHKTVKTTHLVAGDLIELRAGDQIPTDMRVVSADNMTVDKSWLTGESRKHRVRADPQPEHIPYLDARCMLFEGTTVIDGSGWGIAVTTGSHNQVAKIINMANRVHKTSLPHEDVNMIAIVLTSGGLVLEMILLLYWFLYAKMEHSKTLSWRMLLLLIISLMTSIIPISLPVVISGGLSIMADRLKAECRVVVKNLDMIVTLGTITMLITDKTGTLTQNSLSVNRVVIPPDSVLDGESAVYSKSEDMPPFIGYATHRIAVLCNQASLEISSNHESLGPGLSDVEAAPHRETEHKFAFGSNVTDRCIQNWACAQTDCMAIAEVYNVVSSVPFKPVARMAMVVVQHKQNGEIFMLLKGAPEKVLPLCNRRLNRQGVSVEWQPGEWDCNARLVYEQAGVGQRMIALAQIGPLPAGHPDLAHIPDTGFAHVSCLALSDPLRSGVKPTVEQLRAAGITVVMVTGDSVETALYVAQQSGIVRDTATAVNTLDEFHASFGKQQSPGRNVFVLTGDEMEKLSPTELAYCQNQSEAVLARMAVEQRVTMVRQAKSAGHIVAVTGDGINDAPSFREAHVAVAMNTSADITREVSDIVLLNDDFASMYCAVKYGRLVFVNLRKALALILAVGCWVETWTVIVQFVLALPYPLSAVQIVLLCGVHNLFGGLALVCEPAEPTLMTTPPRDAKRHRLLDWRIAAYSFLFYGSMLAIGGFYNYFDYMRSQGYSARDVLFAWGWVWEIQKGTELGKTHLAVSRGACSVFYVTMVVGQAGHLISVRRKGPYFSNTPQAFPWIVLLSIVASFGAAMIFLYVQPIAVYCSAAPVPARYWGLAVGWSALWFAVAEARKWIIFLYPHSWLASMDW